VVENENKALRGKLLKEIRSKLEEKIGAFISSGLNIMALKSWGEPLSFQNVQGFDNQKYTVVVTIARSIDVTGESKDEDFRTIRIYLNVLMKELMRKLNLQQLTRLPKFYDSQNIVTLDQHRLQLWRGYDMAINLMNQKTNREGFLLCIDFASKIVHEESVLAVMRQFRNPREASDELVGRIVMARYGNNTCYRIDEIDFSKNPKSKFDTAQGSMSYIEYYSSKYRLNITDSNQALIKTELRRENRTIYLIPELCVLTGLSDEMRKDYRMMNDIAIYTRLEPGDRLNTSTHLTDRIRTEQVAKEVMRKFNVGINPEPIKVTGQRLNMPQITVGNRQTITLDDKGGFVLRDSVLKPIDINCWAVFATDRDRNICQKFVKSLLNKARDHGVNMAPPYEMDYDGRNPRGLLASIREFITQNKEATMVTIILPENLKNTYSEIKQTVCFNNGGVPSQVVMSKTLFNDKKFDSVVDRVMLQIALKTGSNLWSVRTPDGLPAKTMVIGMDVHHDIVNKGKSVVGFTASIHPQFLEYYNAVRIQPRVGQEIAGNMAGLFSEALVKFFERTGRRFLPELIVVFRDGVADTQVDAVVEIEYRALRDAISKFKDYNPSIIYTVLNKSVSAKFFRETSNGVFNPPPGTVIYDTVIPSGNDFYLVSHPVTQGMARPTLYRVVQAHQVDERLVKRVLPELAFRLCYGYFNWPGGIKVPAPTMMAHKLAFIVGKSLHADNYGDHLRELVWYV
jgi:aubergine-like protein